MSANASNASASNASKPANANPSTNASASSSNNASTAAAQALAEASNPTNASKPTNANSKPTNASNAKAQAANAAAAVVNSNQENVKVSVGNKDYTCVIRKMSENDNAANGEIVVTKNGQNYGVIVTETSQGGRIKRVTRNQKKKKTRSTRK